MRALPKPFPLPRELARRPSCWDTLERTLPDGTPFKFQVPGEVYDSAEEVGGCDWREKRRAILESGGQDVGMFSEKKKEAGEKRERSALHQRKVDNPQEG